MHELRSAIHCRSIFEVESTADFSAGGSIPRHFSVTCGQQRSITSITGWSSSQHPKLLIKVFTSRRIWTDKRRGYRRQLHNITRANPSTRWKTFNTGSIFWKSNWSIRYRLFYSDSNILHFKCKQLQISYLPTYFLLPNQWKIYFLCHNFPSQQWINGMRCFHNIPF